MIISGKNKFFLMIQFFVLLVSFVTVYVQQLPVVYGCGIFLYQLFLFCVGFYAAGKLKILKNDQIDDTAWSYILGISIIVVLYLVMRILNLTMILRMAEIILGIAAFVYYVFEQKKKTDNSAMNSMELACLSIVAFILVLCFFSVSMRSTLPQLSGETYYYNDQLYWIGNTLSVTDGFPLNDYRMVGTSFFYHYFSNVLMADFANLTLLDITYSSLFYSYIVPAILLPLTAFCLFKSVLKDKKLIILGVILSLFTEGMTGTTSYHIYYLPFGFDYGYAFGMMAIAYLTRISVSECFGLKEIILSDVLLCMATGMKGPVAAVILMGYGMVSFGFLIKKEWKKGLLSGAIWLMSFLILYIFVVSEMTASVKTDNGLSFVGLIGGFDSNRYAIQIYADLIELFGIETSKILKIVALGLYVLRSNLTSVSLLVFGVVFLLVRLLKEKKVFAYQVGLMMIGLWGLLLMIVIHHNGYSQLYFGMSMIPFGILLGLEMIENQNRKTQTVFLALVLALSFISVSEFINNAVEKIHDGISVYSGKFDSGSLEYKLTVDDFDMCHWLEINVNKEEYIAVDCFEYNGLKKEEVFGVFSKRYIWNDGEYSADKNELKRRRQLVNEAGEGSYDAIQELKKEGVQYYVQTLDINSKNAFDDRIAIEVYRNNSYCVYKLLG